MYLVIQSGLFLAAVSESVWDFISWFDVSCYVHQEELPHYHNLHQNLTRAAFAALRFHLH